MKRQYHRHNSSARDNRFAPPPICANRCGLMRMRPPFLPLVVAIFVALVPAPSGHAQDSSIDKLLKKLPPPDKVVQADPAAQDPLAKKIIAAVKASNFGNAYAMSQKLAARYPESAGAQSLHGQLALALRHYPQAVNAFQKTISIQPNNAFAYVGLALSEAAQNHVRAAMSGFRQVTRLDPKADVGWIGLSACAEKLGRTGESLDYARRATAVAPASMAAWLQLARAEGISGNQRASANALARANEIRRKAGKADRRG
jgi:tetratricopeptide (TPR) repeat protein